MSGLLTSSGDGTVGQWTVATGEERRDLVLRHKQGASVTGLALAADGTTALTSCEDGHVRVWNVERAEVLRELAGPESSGLDPRPDSQGRVVQAVAVAPDGRLAVTVSPDEQLVRLWDLPTGEEVRFGRNGAADTPYLDFRSRGLLWSAAFSPDGTQLITVGGDMAQLWNVSRTVAPIHETQVFLPHGSVACASFSPDGHYVVTASWDTSARIWNTRTGKAELKLVGHTGPVNSAVFSPDGRYVLTASSDGTAAVWDARTAQRVQLLRGHRDAVQTAAFSSDGARIVTASHDATARIWDAATGEVLCVLEGHRYGVLCATFSADGQYVLTGGEDNTAILWDATSRQPRLVLAGHTAAVTCVAFSPDGKRALTGSDDFTAKLWDTQALDGGAGDSLTRSHRQAARPGSRSSQGSPHLEGSRPTGHFSYVLSGRSARPDRQPRRHRHPLARGTPVGRQRARPAGSQCDLPSVRIASKSGRLGEPTYRGNRDRRHHAPRDGK